MATLADRPVTGETNTPAQHARDHEDAAVIWRALLPTWTVPAAGRIRNMRRLTAELRNPAAARIVANHLQARTEVLGPRQVKG